MIEPRRPPELVLRSQDHPFDHYDSRFMFQKPLVATSAAIEVFGFVAIFGRCYPQLQQLAAEHGGLDYAQAFDDRANPVSQALWFIEDAEVVTALLPSDY